MKNTLCYKGYAARVGFDPDDDIFFGRVVGIRDIVGFHGKTVEECQWKSASRNSNPML